VPKLLPGTFVIRKIGNALNVKSEELKILCRLISKDLKIHIGPKYVLGALHPRAYDGTPK